MRTHSTSTAEAREAAKWWIIDMKGQTLGRAATQIASVLRGKHKPTFTPHIDDGDFVVAINVAEVNRTGRNWQNKRYYTHTGFVGGIKEATASEMRERHPEELLRRAVKGMLPSGPLGRAQLRKLKIFAGAEHKHEAQQPQELNL
ncbi:MAG: 50S ribosomal protein L13 [Myxococcota bacterium]|nr:50S ribosomal protein L13 [Myxococcota bacterium]